MDWDEAVDQLLHAALAASGLIFIAAYPDAVWPYVLAGWWFAFWREDAQHRPDEGWAWMLQGRGRWLDLAFGTLGGAVVGLVAKFN